MAGMQLQQGTGCFPGEDAECLHTVISICSHFSVTPVSLMPHQGANKKNTGILLLDNGVHNPVRESSFLSNYWLPSSYNKSTSKNTVRSKASEEKQQQFSCMKINKKASFMVKTLW